MESEEPNDGVKFFQIIKGDKKIGGGKFIDDSLGFMFTEKSLKKLGEEIIKIAKGDENK